VTLAVGRAGVPGPFLLLSLERRVPAFLLPSGPGVRPACPKPFTEEGKRRVGGGMLWRPTLPGTATPPTKAATARHTPTAPSPAAFPDPSNSVARRTDARHAPRQDLAAVCRAGGADRHRVPPGLEQPFRQL